RVCSRSTVCSDGLRVRAIRLLLFFFQAEDGIRDATVTGVQTCALPILRAHYENGVRRVAFGDIFLEDLREYREKNLARIGMTARSEERRVGKEWRGRRGTRQERKRKTRIERRSTDRVSRAARLEANVQK